MADLCFSRRADNKFLSADEIRVRAPAVYATDVASNLSSRYGSFSTANTIDILNDYGYQVSQAAQINARTISKQHGQHLLAFAKPQAPNMPDQPEIILYNSHDGKSAMKLFAGIFRFICSNGMITGEGDIDKLDHYKSNLDSFEDLLNITIGKLETVSNVSENLKNITPDRGQVLQFARRALETRYDSHDTPKELRERNVYTPRTINEILQPERPEDARNDGWTIFNRVQESIIRGGMHVIGPRKTRGRSFEGYKQVKALSSIKETIDVNRNLWNIAQQTLAA